MLLKKVIPPKIFACRLDISVHVCGVVPLPTFSSSFLSCPVRDESLFFFLRKQYHFDCEDDYRTDLTDPYDFGFFRQ